MFMGTNASVIRVAAVLGMSVAGAANAAIITGSGVDTVTRHFVIDGGKSSVTHDPGLSLDDGVKQTFTISGEFDASFSSYWWSYYADGDAEGAQVTLVERQNWLKLSNSANVGAGLQGFVFPDYYLRITGTAIYGSNSACHMPFGPDTYCSGTDATPISSLTGTYEDGVLALQGSVPVGTFWESFSYSIRANAVPEPGTLALLLCGTAGLSISRRRRLPT